ncbi:alpha-1,6-mannosyltransferase Och1 [Friedmanniomyces endolithicus]|uniref:Initiation-specific alpha-1,6-mannosyltransferase n=1 Tax=Friedmanniomyces endolithicus TaxID=329885 RepID=A0A4U0UWD2_9PEZI|nr:alpha-1,6-mannosyltransferase Och1 [Friedmanniomyces endolithicus]KAK0342810.1 alpha-1,6-mannosyltransferase Och1 [Friedmanniomyces endolithicus]KAK0773540.1 alpha-1,6-mannosyltransferase Och1 [Friedmanniomyces endolithicus]KAK0773878.1 alpha-1,6-mannosyltransferase Och1 [Friedmanniomyces endolithicus]KAK0779289.1 alpha-1,6-mannosyltransferase Och1 [Friedmanniomyces endolithicus]
MLTFRRALAVAAVILTCFLVLRNTHTSYSEAPLVHNSPKPTGSYHDNKVIQDTPPEPASTGMGTGTGTESAKPASTGAAWNGDNGGRVALAKKPLTQLPLEDLKALPIRKQLSYAFPYDAEGKFPAYIWQTWKYTPASGEFSETFRPAEASWTGLHPAFVHEVITDEIAGHLVKHFYATVPEVVEAYNSLPIPVMKADFFRYLILLARGGIYSDIDTTALKSAVEWVPAEVPRSTYGLVIGIEADPDRPDWHEWYSRRIQFCQWTIQSKPGHPILVDVVATITEETLRRKKAGELDQKHIKSVVEFTGPAVWTDAIFKFFNNAEYFDMSTSKGNITFQQFTGIKQAKKVGDVVVLPITSFSPGVGQMGAGEDDDPMAFVKHAFEGTWKPENERHIGA